MQAKKIISGVLLGLSVTLSGALISSAEEIENNGVNNVRTESSNVISQNSREITPYAVHERWVSGIRKPYSLFSTVEKQVIHIDGDWYGVLNLVATEDSYNVFTGKFIKVGIYEGWMYQR